MYLFLNQNGDNYDKKYCESADKIGENTLERYDAIIKDEKNQHIFNNYYFLSFDFEDNRSKNSSQYRINTLDKDKKASNVRIKKDIKEKDIFKELNVNINIGGISNRSNKHLHNFNQLPNINKFKISSTSTSELPTLEDNKQKKLKRTSSLASTNNNTNSNYSLNTQLNKIKSFSNLGNLIINNPGRSLNKLSLSTKNLKGDLQ